MQFWLEAIEEDYFKKNVKIRFSNILDGFNSYKYKNIEPIIKCDFLEAENNLINFMKDLYKLNCEVGSCIVEVYFNKLDNEGIDKLVKGLDENDSEKILKIMEYLSGNNDLDTIYYKVKNMDIINILTKMCTRELFFVTFYFTSIPITIWGNYNLCFPMFYFEDSHLENYIEFISKYNLKLQ